MDTPNILSVSTRARAQQEAVAFPAPVLDLLYACFYLTGLDASPREPLPWAAELVKSEPELVRSAAALIGDGLEGKMLFGLAMDLGYFDDEDPGRFIADLPELPRRIREVRAGVEIEEDMPFPPLDLGERASEVVGALWAKMAPLWRSSARSVAQAAAGEANARLAGGGDVIDALPRRHFLQFEKHVAEMREAYAQGRLRIVPLAFADSGGFCLTGEQVTAVGFGMHGEDVHRVMEETVAKAAELAKVLGDPTRLMLLSLVISYESLSMTVGDLARHLGVTQPTVSGHLKLLRDAGLVTTERKGNRTFPRANREAIADSVRMIGEVLKKRA